MIDSFGWICIPKIMFLALCQAVFRPLFGLVCSHIPPWSPFSFLGPRGSMKELCLQRWRYYIVASSNLDLFTERGIGHIANKEDANQPTN